MADLRPYRPVFPGDTLSAELCNGVQADARREITQHSHSTSLPGEAVSPASALTMRHLELRENLTLDRQNLRRDLSERAPDPASVQGDLRVRGDLRLAGDLVIGGEQPGTARARPLPLVFSASLDLDVGSGGFEDRNFNNTQDLSRYLDGSRGEGDTVLRMHYLKKDQIGLLPVSLPWPARVLVFSQLVVVGYSAWVSLWVKTTLKGRLAELQYAVREHQEGLPGYAELKALRSPSERLEWMWQRTSTGARTDVCWSFQLNSSNYGPQQQFVPVHELLLLPAGDHEIHLRGANSNYYYGRTLQAIAFPF